MGRKVNVIGIKEDGTRKTHEITEEEVREKCVEKYGNRFWVDSDRREKDV